MKFKCWIEAEYNIPDRMLPEVIEQFRKDWGDDKAELYPHDLIRTARGMDIGKLSFDSEEDVECEEPALTEADLPKAKR